MDDEHLTWSELADATSSRVAHVLASGGREARAMSSRCLAENSPFYIASVLGISRVGATAALVNTNLRGRPLAHAVGVANAKVALVSHTLGARAARECEELCQVTRSQSSRSTTTPTPAFLARHARDGRTPLAPVRALTTTSSTSTRPEPRGCPSLAGCPTRGQSSRARVSDP